MKLRRLQRLRIMEQRSSVKARFAKISPTTVSELNGTSYVRWLTLNANGTYRLAVLFGSAPCATTQNIGGDNFLSYGQSGTWTASGLASSPAEAIQVEFTTTSGDVTVRPSLTKGTVVRDFLRDRCSITSFGSGTSPETASVGSTGHICNTTAGVSLPDIPGNSVDTKNIFTLTGSDLNAGSSVSFYHLGAYGYPSSVSESFHGW